MNLSNLEVRQLIEKKRLRYYEVAAALHIDPATLSRWLHAEMAPEKRDKVLRAIEGIKL